MALYARYLAAFRELSTRASSYKRWSSIPTIKPERGCGSNCFQRRVLRRRFWRRKGVGSALKEIGVREIGEIGVSSFFSCKPEQKRCQDPLFLNLVTPSVGRLGLEW